MEPALQQSAPIPISKYRLTTIRGRGQPRRRRYEVCLFGKPRIGEPLVMYGNEEELQIITSKIVRVFHDAAARSTFVQTQNMLYLLVDEEDFSQHP